MTPLSTPPSRQDPANFASRTDAFLGALPVFVTEANALQADVTTKQTQTTLATAAASTAAAAAQAAANSATLAVGAVAWVSGANYAAGFVVYSAVNQRTYRRKTAGTGTTDPSADVGNWALIGLDAVTGQPVQRPALLLDFAASRVVDPRIAFSRASLGAYWDSVGVLRFAAAGEPRIDHDPVTGECLGLLIEEGRTNLLAFSERIDNAAWGRTRMAVAPSVALAPDGSMSACKLIEDASASNDHYANQSYSSYVAGTYYTFSVFAKADSRSNIQLWIPGNVFSNAVVRTAVFNVGTGVVGALGGGVAASVVDVGGGWYRCSMGFLAEVSVASQVLVRLHNGTDSYYTGDGVSGLLVWGAQLEAGGTASSYTATADTFTSRAGAATFVGSNGLVQTAATNVARLQYNPLNLAAAPKLLLEPAATNLQIYAQDLTNATWARNNLSAANTATAPDGTTTATALTATAAANTFITATTVMASAGNTYTFSVWLQGVGATVSQPMVLRLRDGAGVECATATAVLTSAWQRVAVTATFPGGAAANVGVFIDPAIVPAVGDVFNSWGAQLETGWAATSYIFTSTGAASRAADVSSSAQATRASDSAALSGSNFTSWYRPGEGTLFVASSTVAVNASATVGVAVVAALSDGVVSDFQIRSYFGSGISTFDAWGRNAGVAQFDSAGIAGALSTQVRHALAFKANDVATSINGAAVELDTLVSVPTSFNQLQIGGGGTGHIQRVAYYKRRLSNAELQALTV